MSLWIRLARHAWNWRSFKCSCPTACVCSRRNRDWVIYCGAMVRASNGLPLLARCMSRQSLAKARRLILTPRWKSLIVAFLLLCLCVQAVGALPVPPFKAQSSNPIPPALPVKVIFIHHSTGENWLGDDNGGLGIALRDAGYFVSDTNYGWGPTDLDVDSENIGDHTDIGHWYNWFAGPHHNTYLTALYAESGQHSDYSRLASNPGGQNEIIMFKSCFPNSNLGGKPNDPPKTGQNLLRGESSGSEYHTVGNAKGIYNDLLAYFASRQDKLFIVITAPPLADFETSPEAAANARALNNWLLNDWLKSYTHHNVFIFDFYNVLTSNGGDANTNDLGRTDGNHHRLWNNQVQHIQTLASNTSAYPTDDSHPSAAGGQKASAEFVPLLNVAYRLWKGATLPT